MATINGSTSSSLWTYKLEVTENSYSIENNTSSVTVTAYIGRASSTSYLGGSWSGSITVDGSTQNMSGTIPYPTYINGGGWLELSTKTFSSVPHNSDGSKTASVSSSFSSSAFTPSSASASGDVVLTTIPRASTITATSAYILETSLRVPGVSQITVTKKNEDFTHTIAYSFGSLSGYILADGTTTSTATKISASSIGFTIPTTWFGQIPNDPNGVCTLTITTYSGNTQIGSSQTTTFVVNVDANASSPTVTSSVVDTNQTIIALTGSSSILVKGYSTASVTYNTTTRDSATLSNVKINGTTVTSSPYSFTLNEDYINVIATDSRGFPTASNPTFTLKNYSAPSFSMEVARISPTSDSVNMSFEGTWFNQSFGSTNNTLQLSWKYREKGDTNWITGGTLVNNTDYKISGNTFYSGNGSSVSTIEIGGDLDYDYNWEIALVATDRLNEIIIVSTITQGKPIVNWNDSNLYFNGDDFIIETFAPYDFTNQDAQKILDYIYGGTLTPSELKKYDVNKDGRVDISDYIIVEDYISQGIDTTHSGKIKIHRGTKLENFAFTIEDGNANKLMKLNKNGLYFNEQNILDDFKYSASEVKTNQIWENGKPLYRKVLSFTDTLTGGVTFSKALDIPNVDIIFIDTSHSFIYSTTNNLSMPLPGTVYYGNFSDRIGVHIDRNYLYCYQDTSWGNTWVKNFTILYTKTTD